MLRHTWLLIIGGCLLLAGLAAISFYFASRPTTLKFAVAAANPEDVRLIQAIAQQFARDRATIRLVPVLEDGPQQSAAALDAGKADLAIVRADLALPKQGLAVAVLRQNVVVMIVPAAGSPAKAPAAHATGKAAKAKAKKIEKVEDLPGHRIGVIGRSGGTNNTDILNVILRHYEIPADKVTIVTLDPDNVGAAVRKDPVDVILAVGPVTSRFITDAIAASSSAKDSPGFLAIGASEAIANRLPAYESTELKQGVFGGKKPLPDDTVETIAFNHYIVARTGLSDGLVGDFTHYLFGVRQSLKQELPAIAKIEKPDTDKDAAVQAHPGAAAYIDDDQKTFFDRYSDMLYWGMIMMGFFGTAITWVTSHVKADERARRMRVIEHLLDAVQAARTAQTLAEIDKLRIDVDDILKRTLQKVERNDLDEPALMAFSLALDQAQLAISDRRSALTARGMQATITAGAADSASAAQATPVSAEITPLRIAKTADQG
jgi:TRAP-type uncharacterized transport system substrate-binding protein